MKVIILIFFCLCQYLSGFCQNQKTFTFSDYKLHVIINTGAILHTNKTVNQTNKIKGLTTFDISPSLRFLYFFSNKSNALSIGAEYNSFTNKFRTRSGYYDDYDGEFRSIVSGGFYYKITFNYNYFIRLSNKLNLGMYIGPGYFVQRKHGLYDKHSWYSEISENNTLLYTFENRFEAKKIARETFGAQFGGSFNYIFAKKHALIFNIGYNLGFKVINQTNVDVLINNATIDNGIIYSKGNGINISLGFSFPLNI